MSGALTGKKVLIVEDEYFIAADLKKELSGRGAVVIGPVGNLMSALSLIQHEQLDAAILDVNLEGSGSYPLMEELGRKSIHCVLLTGDGDGKFSETWPGAARIAKPCSTGAVVELLEQTARPDR